MLHYDEKDLEDFLCSQADGRTSWRITNLLMTALPEGNLPDKEGTTYAARQVTVPCGVADIVCRLADRLYVCELKAHEADGNALAQVLAYAAYFQEQVSGTAVEVDCVLIAQSFSEKVRHATANTNVHLIAVEANFGFASYCEDIWSAGEAQFDDRARKAIDDAIGIELAEDLARNADTATA